MMTRLKIGDKIERCIMVERVFTSNDDNIRTGRQTIK
jgi:hypothetical protein